ncbi:hypothetical protein QCA50_018268 [Cerrena zonata]|uniref:RBR-type E3 ubiquitin transferase n=1 Tax=Cerrena zonata TaxID=2478898 RepID=A0AAW0FDF0_9APHY
MALVDSSRPRYGDRTSRLLSDCEETYAALANLSIEDATGDMPVDSDTAYAIRLAREEAILQRQFDVNRALAESLQNADEDEDEPNILNQGRGLRRMTQIQTIQPVVRTISTPNHDLPKGTMTTSPIVPIISTSWWGSLVSQWWNGLGSSSNVTVAESSRAHERRLTGHDCVICGDAIRGTEVHTPCNHYYDKNCIVELFQAATRDETLYPPRCCRQHIPLSSVRGLLTADAIKLFEQKAIEFGTLNRVYCSNPRCSRFLCAQQEGPKRATLFKCAAPGCNTQTCTGCKAHVDTKTGSSHVCQKDANDQDVLELGRHSQWARCPGCEALIELNLGCYHMTCRCKTEFCYLCRAKWKRCQCPQWEERRLLAAAEARVDAQLGFPPIRRAEIRPRVPPRRDTIVVRAVPREPHEEGPLRMATLLRQGNRHASATQTNLADRTHTEAVREVPVVSTNPFRRHERGDTTVTHDEGIESWRRQVAGSSTADSLQVPIAPVQPSWRKRDISTTNSSSSGSKDTLTAQNKLQKRNTPAVDIDSWRHQSASVSTPRPVSITSGTTPLTPSSSKGKGKQPETPTRWQLIREAMEHLRVNHECTHLHWRYRKGGGNCDHCHCRLPIFLYVS